MSIPLMEFAPSSANVRVDGFEVPGDEQPRIFTTDYLTSSAEQDALIQAAYRQVFHPQQTLSATRQVLLESQLRSGQITVQDFVRGLAKSDAFRRLNFDVNNNYRFVEICVQRLLGRPIYNNQEKMALSIVLATQGLPAFIDTLINSEEYTETFGANIVPYQRRRILPQRTQGELPFERMPRYGTDYRNKLPKPVANWAYGQPASFELPLASSAATWSRLSLVLIGGFILIFALLALNAWVA